MGALIWRSLSACHHPNMSRWMPQAHHDEQLEVLKAENASLKQHVERLSSRPTDAGGAAGGAAGSSVAVAVKVKPLGFATVPWH